MQRIINKNNSCVDKKLKEINRSYNWKHGQKKPKKQTHHDNEKVNDDLRKK